MIDIVGGIDTNTRSAKSQRNSAIPGDIRAAHTLIDEAKLRAALRMVDAGGGVRRATANAIRADLGQDADVAAVAAVLAVLVRVDATKIAADPARAVEAGASTAVSRTALPVVLAGLLILDAGGFG